MHFQAKNTLKNNYHHNTHIASVFVCGSVNVVTSCSALHDGSLLILCAAGSTL
jgi:hypothetical protein